MSKTRSSIAVLCVLCSLICVISAKPKPLTKKQQEAKQNCDDDLDVCMKVGCAGATGTQKTECENLCIDDLTACYKKIGISLPPRNPRLPPHVPTTGLQPTASPGSTPKSKVPPTGPVTQASPSRHVPPHGAPIQASPSASPNTILRTTPKKTKHGH
jgi:hypothetical protein